MSTWLALSLFIASFVILLLRHDVPTVMGMDAGYSAVIISAIGLVIYMVGSHFKENNRLYVPQLVQHVALFLMLGCLSVVTYQYRSEIFYVAANVGSQVHDIGNKVVAKGIQITFPGRGGKETIVQIRKRPDGHFVARTQVNDVELNLIVDTGATVVVLKPSDAERVGYKIDELSFQVPVQTANGIAHAARIRLHKVSVGPLTAYNVDAFVVRRGTLQRSLLGLSFLNRLRSYEVSGNYLSLKG